MDSALAVEFHAHNVWPLINAWSARAPTTTIMERVTLAHLSALPVQVLSYAYHVILTLMPPRLGSAPSVALLSKDVPHVKIHQYV
jgi:hypothetical protein